MKRQKKKINELPAEALKKYFGFDEFRANQEEIISEIINGKNVVAVLPTGAGKSLCYQLPALISENFSIVVSPLIALMKDQVDALNRNTEIAAFINSSMSFSEAEQVLQNIAYGKYKMLYVWPERLGTTSFAERIKTLNPTYLFVDEAHCISEWGHNFRPSYRKISEFIKFIDIKNVSAFTATATPEVINDIVEQLNFKDPEIFVRGFERNNLQLNVQITRRKLEKCFELISIYKTPAIVYTASRKKAEEVSEVLNLHKIGCSYYHAGLAPEERKKIQEDFINDKVPVIAATNAFGMGIDKKDIRLIIHYNMPGTIENYYQEIGRAGRDGNPATAFLLHEDSDINIQNFLLSNSHPDKELIKNVYDAVCDYGKVAEGNISEKEIPVNKDYISSYVKKELGRGLLFAALNILENGGYIKQISEFSKKTSVQIILEKNRLQQFAKNTSNEYLKEIILLLLREYGSEIFINKIYISLAQMGQALGLLESEVLESLIILDNLGIIIFNNPLPGQNIKLTSPRINSGRLTLDYDKINKSYLYQQKKIEDMVNYVYSDECRFKIILKYFGEDTEEYECGKCDNCANEDKLPENISEYLKEIILRTLNSITSPVSEAVLFSILRGNKSAEKFSRLETFSSCQNYSNDEIKFVLLSLVAENFIEKPNARNKVLLLSGKGAKYIEEKGLAVINKKEIDNYEDNLEIFNFLNQVRVRAARRFLQEGYLICPDEVLKEVASKRPKNRNELISIKGFNLRMYNKIGQELLEVLTEFEKGLNKPEVKVKEQSEIPQNIKETYKLLRQGYSLADISSLRKLNDAVISMQIETILEYAPDTEIKHLYNKGMLEKVFDAIKEGFGGLKELKEKTGGEIGYPLLRIALAKYRSSS